MKPNIWVSSSQAKELLKKQLVTWPLARQNYKAFEDVQLKTFDMGGFEIKVQFNPSRIVSAGAKLDAQSIRERKCFLCPDNLPVEQERLPFGRDYLVLCNPYPLLPEHFTIASREHIPQSISYRFPYLLEIARRMNTFTHFYNGPRSGASAPDHAHFQSGTHGYMPIDYEIDSQVEKYGNLIKESGTGKVYAFTHYLRNGFVIKAKQVETLQELFNGVFYALNMKEDETEPMMNIFSGYKDGWWTVIVIPRKQHRPRQFNAEGDEQITISPGAADIGGLLITPQQKDFEKMNSDLIRDIYAQVCFNDSEIESFAKRIV